MPTVAFACVLLLAATTLLHYEVLGSLHRGLPRLRIPDRSKLLVVIAMAFAAHVVEMAMYGGAYYGLIEWLRVGSLSGSVKPTLGTYMYFSSETYTSLGLGDIAASGPVRLLVGAEALNGLLLIGWSASFTYIAMERFWTAPHERGSEHRWR